MFLEQDARRFIHHRGEGAKLFQCASRLEKLHTTGVCPRTFSAAEPESNLSPNVHQPREGVNSFGICRPPIKR
jgi:hypothetical protein